MGGSTQHALSPMPKPSSAVPHKRLQPGTTAKKLPWLDGKASPSVRSPGVIAENPAPSPLQRPPSIRSSPSPGASSPPPTARLGVVHPRRQSLGRAPATPRRSIGLSHPPASHEPRKRLSIVKIDESEGSGEDVRPRADSLAPVPDHLERIDTPESIPQPVQRIAHTSSPRIIKSVNMSPTHPIPRRDNLGTTNQRKLSTAIEGLEDLVQDAVVTAEDTADPRQVEELYEIIEDARHAIQEASAAPAQRLMRTSSPLEASGTSEEVSSFSSSSSASEYASPQASPSQRIWTDSAAPSQGTSNQHQISSGSARLPHGQQGSNAIDWAYQNQNEQGEHKDLSRSSSHSSSRQGRSRFSTQSDFLLPPEPIQNAPRDHVDFVLRPAIAREHSRGRSPERRGSSSDQVRRRRRHRRSRRSSEDPSRSGRRRPLRTSSSLSQFDTSLDEDLNAPSKTQGVKRYGAELRVREQAHHHTFSLRRNHRRQHIARNWRTGKKRITAVIACINTALLGIIVGIYAGEVPRIQYMLADESHHVIIGNVVLYAGLAISTFIAWPLPLLHGRKPYILASLALAMPLQFPQALVVGEKRSPNNPSFRTGLLVARAASGLVLGFANVNFLTILLDLFGASLQSKHPHQEFTVPSDVRRHGGGMGLWLGIWSWCAIGSLAVGFQIGAGIIASLTPDWGFYIVIIILAAALVLNVLAPETRRSAYRRSVTEVYDRDENYITRRVARGEIKLHIATEGPKYWFEEVWAGMKLMIMMLCQPGFLVLAVYLAWIYAQIVLVIVLLGALLSRDYKWHPEYVGLGVMSIAIGALLAVPLTKAGIFSRERKTPFRTDSMTFQKQVTWSSHLVRRVIFTLTLPLMGIAYTVSSAGKPKPYMVPIVFAGAVGFLSILAIAECHGLIMETFDTCDLQPGVNTRHRLQSMAVQDRRRRTNYSSFPRVSAGIFASQSLAFVLAAVATEVGGIMTRRIGAQASTGVTAGILLFLTLLLTLVLWRFKEVQVIPNHTFGTRRDTRAWQEFRELEKEGRGSDWKAVVIGNPSGKMRRMSVLELGSLSRWTEIRKLNFLIRGKERKKRDDWGRSW